MNQQKTVGIIGAGIMGRVVAWQLVQQGYQVSLFDKDPIASGEAAAYSAAGMITPFAELESTDSLVFQMGLRSLALWPQLEKQLKQSIGFQQRGSLVVSHGADRPDFNRFNHQLNTRLTELEGATEAIDCQPPAKLNKAQLAQLEPALQFDQATYLPAEAWVCPEKTLRILAEQLLACGVNWYPETAVQHFCANHLFAAAKPHSFDWVIDCRGLGASTDLKRLRGVRGELILLQAPAVKISRLVRLIHPRYRLYIVPKQLDDRYLIGATQIESDDAGPITVRSTLELLSAAYSIDSGFAEARVLGSKTSCRPALVDNFPRVEVTPGLIRINGLFRHGFLLAPAIAESVCQSMQNIEPTYAAELYGAMV